MFIFDIRPVLVADAENPNQVAGAQARCWAPTSIPWARRSSRRPFQPGRAWLDYNFVDPASGRYETKHLWVVLHDRLVFGSGWYESGPSRSQLSTFTQSFVQQAVNLYEATGRDRTVDYYNTARSTDGQWYVFIADEQGVLIAHPTIPAKVGQSLLGDIGVDETGYPFGHDLLTATGDGLWVAYRSLNSHSGEVEGKHTWVVRHDGLYFASGWYGMPPAIIGLRQPATERFRRAGLSRPGSGAPSPCLPAALRRPIARRRRAE